MDLDLLPEAAPMTEGIDIERVYGNKIDDFTEVLCPSWGIAPQFRDGVFEMMRGLDVSDDGEFKAYVLYASGVPSSSLLIYRQQDIAGVQLVSTLPSQRGKGLAQRLLISSLAEARDHGATHSVLEATKMGVRSYERLGFVGCGWSRYFAPPARSE
jgi:GNAT superfamily N-acetyltransferase